MKEVKGLDDSLHVSAPALIALTLSLGQLVWATCKRKKRKNYRQKESKRRFLFNAGGSFESSNMMLPQEDPSSLG